MERSIERTQVFFNKLKEYIDYLGKPSYSKEELKKKKFLAENITRFRSVTVFSSVEETPVAHLILR